MNQIKFVIGLTLLLGLIYLGNTHGAVKAGIPAIGKLFDPFGGAWQQAVPAGSQATEVVTGTSVKGEVVIDEKGIPHIFAPTVADAMYLQGYMHARDRLFQMDISARAAGGRLSEILGDRTLGRDRLQRRKGMRVAAQRAVDRWLENPETADAIQAYVAGVNAHITSLTPANYPIEYKLIGFEPEAWTVLKSALFSKNMAESLCFRHADIATTNTRAILGDSLFAHLYPEHNPEESPVIPNDTAWPFGSIPTMSPTSPAIGPLSFPEMEMSPEGVGSNNWALAGAKTASGAPLLSNDPHLNLTLPSIWYELQIHTPQLNVYGVSLPTLPGILIGFNESSAWGITNAGHDVLDWYQINWTDSTYQKYQLDEQELSPEWVKDTIWVRHQAEPVIVKTPWTIFGPMVYDQPDDQRYNLAMRWVAHDALFDSDTDNIETFLRLATNNSLAQYRDAIRGFDSPASNIVYANQQNDIALTVTGRLPLRKDQQGRYVQAASKANMWPGYIPFAELPQVANPEHQYVSSANQRSTGTNYPYYYLGGFEDYRGRYINRKLAALEKATPEDMMALQQDAYSIKAEEALPVLLAALDQPSLNANQQAAQALLRNWDFQYRAEQQAPVLFDAWFDRLYELTFDEIYARNTDERPMVFPEDWRLIQLLEAATEDPIFDRYNTLEQIESREELIRQSFTEACEAVWPQLAAGLDWSTHRASQIGHLGRIPGFGSGLLTTDGARNTPNSLSGSFGPSWRMVVSLEKPVRAWGVLPGGSSGNVGSPFYDNGVKTWAAGDYFELRLYSSSEEVPVFGRLVFE